MKVAGAYDTLAQQAVSSVGDAANVEQCNDPSSGTAMSLTVAVGNRVFTVACCGTGLPPSTLENIDLAVAQQVVKDGVPDVVAEHATAQ